jgi:addiction module RelE/StbE family toxin
MKFDTTQSFTQTLKKLAKKQPSLTTHLDKKAALLITNQNHPSLRLHKLSGKNRWSISINRKLRILFRYTKDGILFTDIGTHDEVY